MSSDSMGGWRVWDTLGQSLLDLPETLVRDLLVWKELTSIARRQKESPSIPSPSSLDTLREVNYAPQPQNRR